MKKYCKNRKTLIVLLSCLFGVVACIEEDSFLLDFSGDENASRSISVEEAKACFESTATSFYLSPKGSSRR